jgi:hypothetical protein
MTGATKLVVTTFLEWWANQLARRQKKEK